MLEDNQIWENEEYVLKIEKWETVFHALVFLKIGNSLRFVNIVIDKDERIEKLLQKMNVQISNKFITLKEKEDEKLQEPNLEK
jgi:hypothetical protein